MMGKHKPKAALVTFSQAINYGAVLQMYALQKTLENLNYECDVLNYKSKSIAKTYEKPDFLNPKVLAYLFIHNSYIRFNFVGFQEFLDRYIKFGEEVFYSEADLSKVNDKYDLFITGSDQVFNLFCSGFDTNYFLTFVKDPRKKFSYAASVGLTEIPEDMIEKYRNLLSSFNQISIREHSGANLISNLIKKKCQCNIDPTLLLSTDDWRKISKDVDIKEPYVLLYMISEDKRVLKFSKKLAKIKHCKVIYINDRLIKPLGVNSFRNITPCEWLSLMFNADSIITNSFHGIAFSISFRKEFYPFYLNKNTKVNSRIRDLLQLFGLENLLISDKDTITVALTKAQSINYDSVHKILNLEKISALTYLKSLSFLDEKD